MTQILPPSREHEPAGKPFPEYAYRHLNDFTVTLVGKNVIFIGQIGRATDQDGQSSFCRFDAFSQEWYWIDCNGPYLVEPKTLLHGDSLYCFSEWTGRKNQWDGNVNVFTLDVVLQEWSGCIAKYSPPRWELGVIEMLSDGLAVIVHDPGFDKKSREFGDVSTFDVNSLTWTIPLVKGNPPARRRNYSSCSDERALYIYGGENPLKGGDGLVLSMSGNGIYRLEHICKYVVWSQIEGTSDDETKTPVRGCALCYSGGRLFVFGGSDANYDPCVELKYFEIKDETWQDYSPEVGTAIMYKPREKERVLVSQNKAFFFGGFTRFPGTDVLTWDFNGQ